MKTAERTIISAALSATLACGAYGIAWATLHAPASSSAPAAAATPAPVSSASMPVVVSSTPTAGHRIGSVFNKALGAVTGADFGHTEAPLHIAVAGTPALASELAASPNVTLAGIVVSARDASVAPAPASASPKKHHSFGSFLSHVASIATGTITTQGKPQPGQLIEIELDHNAGTVDLSQGDGAGGSVYARDERVDVVFANAKPVSIRPASEGARIRASIP
ncbi:MAG TPA: hypothetical protein VFQ88_09420 [Nevskiaceae bacterium]|nr:hypothetical protein [Nevskiaceae bacterium]